MTRYPQQSRPWSLEYGQAADRTVFNFFNAVYAWMAVGLAVTAAVAWYVAHSSLIYTFASMGIGGLLMLSLVAFGIAWFVQAQAGRMNPNVGIALFLLYATIMGALSSFIFIVYPASTLIGAFVLTAGTFGGLSVYGFVTKRDLTGIGSMAVMAVFGVILASIMNVFLANDMLDWLITYAILALFIVITAYQTQRLRVMAEHFRDAPQMAARFAVVGSLVLYIAFMNLFYSILRILGDRR